MIIIIIKIIGQNNFKERVQLFDFGKLGNESPLGFSYEFVSLIMYDCDQFCFLIAFIAFRIVIWIAMCLKAFYLFMLM